MWHSHTMSKLVRQCLVNLWAVDEIDGSIVVWRSEPPNGFREDFDIANHRSGSMHPARVRPAARLFRLRPS